MCEAVITSFKDVFNLSFQHIMVLKSPFYDEYNLIYVVFNVSNPILPARFSVARKLLFTIKTYNSRVFSYFLIKSCMISNLFIPDYEMGLGSSLKLHITSCSRQI